MLNVGGIAPSPPSYAYIYISKILSAFNQIDTFLAFQAEASLSCSYKSLFYNRC